MPDLILGVVMAVGASLAISDQVIAQQPDTVGDRVAQDALYRIRSRDMGIEEFDLAVMETKRTPRTSVLHVPGFHERSASASRWLMCVYTHVAFLRGFQYWAAVYPELSSEDVLIGFPDTHSEDVSETLGPEFVGPMASPTSVKVFEANVCGKLDEWPAIE